MSTQRLWMLQARADTADAVLRGIVARAWREFDDGRSSCVLLETCHRVELYGFGSLPNFRAPLRLVEADEAVKHLMRVAAGLDSAIVGEDEVLHQVREALAIALARASLDPRLQRLFETAIAAGRRARAGRSQSSGNLAQRAIAWLQQKSSLAGREVLVVGAGRMGSALARAAQLAGAELTIASRNTTRANRLAQIYGAASTDLAGGAQLAPRSTGVAVALAGPWEELKLSESHLPPIADISTPAAVDAEIRDKMNGGYLGIDDLYVRSQPVPGGYIEEGERVVEAKTAEYLHWLNRNR